MHPNALNNTINLLLLIIVNRHISKFTLCSSHNTTAIASRTKLKDVYNEVNK